MLSILVALVAVDLANPPVDADQFLRLMRTAHAPYKDISVIMEGARSYIGPAGVFENAVDYEDSYQTFFAYKKEIAIFQDVFRRPRGGDGILDRTTSVWINENLDILRRIPDLGKSSRSSRRAGALYCLYDVGSPTRIFFLPYFGFLKDPTEYGYRFENWEQIGGHNCLRVRLSLWGAASSNGNEGADDYQLFWIDLERGGNVLRHDWVEKSKLISRVDNIELELYPSADGNSLWVPVRGEYKSFARGRIEFFDRPLFRETYALVRGSVVLNQGLTDKQFSVDWNWVHPGESIEMRTLRQSKTILATRDKQPIDPKSVRERLEKSLSQADKQAESLEASSLARIGSGWTTLCQILGVTAGVIVLGAAVWLRKVYRR